MPVIKVLGITFIIAMIGIGILSCGVFVIRAPEKFLNSALARHRFPPETPKSQIRAFGLVMIVGGALFLGFGSLTLFNLLTGN